MLLLIPLFDMRRNFFLRKLAHGLHQRLVIIGQFKIDHLLTLFSSVVKMTGHLTQVETAMSKSSIHTLRRLSCNLRKSLCYTLTHAQEKSIRGRSHRRSGADELCAGAGSQFQESDRGYQRRRQTRRPDRMPAGTISLAVLLSNRRYPALQTGRNDT